ncbi:hypothetical protein [Bordetella sp. 02P26C-1]|uniref:hypothetical protein n=1 Tax=Bordetella sp. 02P26C-1 TaxID=2683195 RepID=UPI0013530D66|nr:hypothetical protein [Bordetella sp. 02P26C-1]MVW78326.1 hypothetical protein [Bordetella sp. 02P26C-1]
MIKAWWYRGFVVSGAASLLLGCSTQHAPVEQVAVETTPPRPVSCSPAPAGSALIGRWLSNTRPSGVAGDFRALIVLEANGTMTYDTQLKVGKRIRPGLREAGCWELVDGVLTLQTVKSNGEAIDTSDPIYRNQYRVEKVESTRLELHEVRKGGQSITARRMPASYRLPD